MHSLAHTRDVRKAIEYPCPYLIIVFHGFRFCLLLCLHPTCMRNSFECFTLLSCYLTYLVCCNEDNRSTNISLTGHTYGFVNVQLYSQHAICYHILDQDQLLDFFSA